MTPSSQKVALVVGASRGIGREVAIGLSREGYAVAVAAKSTSDPNVKPFPPDPNSPLSTINTVAREIEEAGGRAAPIAVDTRDSSQVQRMVDEVVKTFGRIDVVVYNSGAIWWSSVANTSYKRFELMQKVNIHGLYATVQAVLPYFEANGSTGRMVVVSPPIYSRFFRGKTAYAVGKVGMSVLTKGLAMDWEREGKKDMAITSIWPAAAIESAATGNAAEVRNDLRKPTIFSDAILAILKAPAPIVNGALELDEDFLRTTGETDFSKYSVVPGSSPRRIMPAKLPDLTVAEQADEGRRVDSTQLRNSKL